MIARFKTPKSSGSKESKLFFPRIPWNPIAPRLSERASDDSSAIANVNDTINKNVERMIILQEREREREIRLSLLICYLESPESYSEYLIYLLVMYFRSTRNLFYEAI